MNFVSKAIRRIVDILMILFFVIGTFSIWTKTQPNPVVPNGPDDLGSIQVTVKTLEKALWGSDYILYAEEYPTKFVLSTYPSPPENIRSLVQIGHKVNVNIKRESIPELQGISLVWAYGLTLEDGTNVFDTSRMVPKHVPLTSFSFGNAILLATMVIPILYLLVRITYRRRRFSSSIPK